MKIRPNDYVLHNPTGEEWVVCGINYEQGYLVPCGYPFPSMAKIEDCELTESNGKPQDDEQREALRRYGLDSYIEIEVNIKRSETTGFGYIEKHECYGLTNYSYLGKDYLLALEKASVCVHDVYFHWYLFRGKKGEMGMMLKDLKYCPFCGEKLSDVTLVPDFDEPDEW